MNCLLESVFFPANLLVVGVGGPGPGEGKWGRGGDIIATFCLFVWFDVLCPSQQLWSC